MDCDPASSSIVAKQYEKSANIEILRNAAALSKNGVTLRHIIEAAEKISLLKKV